MQCHKLTQRQEPVCRLTAGCRCSGGGGTTAVGEPATQPLRPVCWLGVCLEDEPTPQIFAAGALSLPFVSGRGMAWPVMPTVALAQ